MRKTAMMGLVMGVGLVVIGMTHAMADDGGDRRGGFRGGGKFVGGDQQRSAQSGVSGVRDATPQKGSATPRTGDPVSGVRSSAAPGGAPPRGKSPEKSKGSMLEGDVWGRTSSPAAQKEAAQRNATMKTPSVNPGARPGAEAPPKSNDRGTTAPRKPQ